MNIAHFNGDFLPKEKIHISADDRGFIFGDGVYEVIKWYGSCFFDIESHLTRLKRSLREVRINWPEVDSFPVIAGELIKVNNLIEKQALIYLQVTRGEALRNHAFPDPEVPPTIYAFARETGLQKNEPGPGVRVSLRQDIRWSRCDIKSVSLLANTLSFQDAHERGMQECIFVRNGLITEGSRSNIFLVAGGTLFTHPESEYILSGVTRKNIIRFAKESGIVVKEVPFPEKDLGSIQEAFICNTSAEVTPVIGFESMQVTLTIYRKFLDEINYLKSRL
jgi:D-alanine transaminase